ncbi:MAG: hypothetical protein UT02_C0027G0012 [Parcubacteria group bacterium GW2011_GWC2_38_7]|nr:MAG: hypothetical protein UT02_C0027G0012 [Parcubacteria group bacterium GW2011_GWC2_38_7]
MSPEQSAQIDALLERAEMDGSSKELMRSFFDSISGQPQFGKIISLFGRFPAVFENFCKCFSLKKEFLAKGKSEAEWNQFLSAEDEVLSKLE